MEGSDLLVQDRLALLTADRNESHFVTTKTKHDFSFSWLCTAIHIAVETTANQTLSTTAEQKCSLPFLIAQL